MGLVFLGAGIMLVGVLVGYGISESNAPDYNFIPMIEEVAKWEQEIDEVNKN